MACNLLNALKQDKKCKITMAGTGDRVYFFDKNDLLDGGQISLPEPDDKGVYEEKAFDNLNGKLAAVDIKTDSGQVTSEKGADNEANSQVGTFVVADNVEDFNELEHALRFKDFGCFIPKVGGGYYVIMSPYKKTTIESNYDSGTTYDSDHGFTVTVTAAPAEFSVTTWYPKAEGKNVELKTWAIPESTDTPATEPEP